MDDLLPEFIAETRELLEAAQEELVAWEANPSDRARLDGIFRFVHTVKGNCGFFDLPRLADLSHAAESALAEVRAGNRHPDTQFIDAIFAVVDRIAGMMDVLDTGAPLPPGDDADLVAVLKVAGTEAAKAKVSQHVSDDAAPAASTHAARSIRLPINLLDRVMGSVSDLVLIRNEVGRLIREADVDPSVSTRFDRLAGIVEDLRDGISQMRMHRLDHLFGPMPRLVRDLCAELGKKAVVEFEGGEVELDREIIELIRDPFVHILRNAIDHGIETPAERAAANKDETGHIQILARQTGNRISIAIADDGNGIDTGKLVHRAIAAKVVTAEDCAAMTEAERQDLIFEPGISTASEVTSVSGRGVGMDVVRANIERLGGEITVSSELAEGTRLFISLPATLSIVPSLTVRVGEHRFGIPRSYVEEIVSSRSDSLEFNDAGDARLVRFRGKQLRCTKLSQVLQVEDDSSGECDLLILKIASGDLFAMAVDQVISHEELVVKPLAEAIMATNLYTGASLLDDGSLVLMLHIAGIAIEENLLSDLVKKTRKKATLAEDTVAQVENIPCVAFVPLGGGHRLVRMDAVQRIAKVEVDAVRIGQSSAQIVIDDGLMPLVGVAQEQLPDERLNILILSDGERKIAYAIDRVLDTVSIDARQLAEPQDGEVEGVALLEERAVEVLNCHWLFARHASPIEAEKQSVCRIDLDNAWARTILQPLVQSAGFRVIDADSDEIADVAIQLQDSGENALQGRETVTLHSDSDAKAEGDEGVYRYDRDALLSALRLAQRKSA